MSRSNSLPIARISRRTAADDVREQIAALIEQGRLQVNERLPSEFELAKEFGVSRPVIREALTGLNALGLTTSYNGRGTFVVANSVRLPLLRGQYLPEQLNEVRHCLEVPAARLAALRRSDEDLQMLSALLLLIEGTEDPEIRNKHDVDFHVAIALASGNPLLVKLTEDLRSILEEYALAASAVPTRRSGASAEHRVIYDAILRQDADAAAEAMSHHLMAAREAFSARPAAPRGASGPGGP